MCDSLKKISRAREPDTRLTCGATWTFLSLSYIVQHISICLYLFNSIKLTTWYMAGREKWNGAQLSAARVSSRVFKVSTRAIRFRFHYCYKISALYGQFGWTIHSCILVYIFSVLICIVVGKKCAQKLVFYTTTTRATRDVCIWNECRFPRVVFLDFELMSIYAHIYENAHMDLFSGDHQLFIS